MPRKPKRLIRNHPRIICARVSDDLLRKIHLLAKARDVSVTEILRFAVRDYIESHIINDAGERVA